MTCKDWGMSGRIHSQWHCSAASQSLHTTHPSKKCHPLWSLQHPPNPLPFDHNSSNTQQSLRALISDVLFSLSVPPSISLIVCLSFSEKKPTCVSTLSWHGCPSPTAQASGSHKAGHLKQRRSAGQCGIWSLAIQLRVTKRGTLTKCHLSRQTDRKCVRKREWLLGLVFLRDGTGEREGS